MHQRNCSTSLANLTKTIPPPSSFGYLQILLLLSLSFFFFYFRRFSTFLVTRLPPFRLFYSSLFLSFSVPSMAIWVCWAFFYLLSLFFFFFFGWFMEVCFPIFEEVFFFLFFFWKLGVTSSLRIFGFLSRLNFYLFRWMWILPVFFFVFMYIQIDSFSVIISFSGKEFSSRRSKVSLNFSQRITYKQICREKMRRLPSLI